MGLHEQEERRVIYTEKPPYPQNMMIELTNACNHQCVFCGNRKQKRKIRNADEKQMYSIIQQAVDLGVKEVGFYLGGEPLLYRNLEKLIQFARKATSKNGGGY